MKWKPDPAHAAHGMAGMPAGMLQAGPGLAQRDAVLVIMGALVVVA